jgi:hypothetical protein
MSEICRAVEAAAIACFSSKRAAQRDLADVQTQENSVLRSYLHDTANVDD